MSKIFAMSDLHGCYREFMAMLDKLPIDFKEDKLVICGDIIDRGPDSKRLIDQLIKMEREHGLDHVVVVYGNHEDLMCDALLYGGRKYDSFDLWYTQGGRETAHSYLPPEYLKPNLTEEQKYEKALFSAKDLVDQDHLVWLASLPRYHVDGDYVFVHGGLKPDIPLEDQKEQDLIWIRDEFIRSQSDFEGKKIIFGHTADSEGYYDPQGRPFQPIIMANKIGIDTAVCPPTQNGLTCVELPSETFYFQSSFKDTD